MRGEVFVATAGTKTRPVVEISEPELDRPVIAHLTTVQRAIPTHVAVVDLELAGMERECWINVHAVEAIDRSRLGRPIGRLDSETLRAMSDALAIANGCWP